MKRNLVENPENKNYLRCCQQVKCQFFDYSDTITGSFSFGQWRYKNAKITVTFGRQPGKKYK